MQLISILVSCLLVHGTIAVGGPTVMTQYGPVEGFVNSNVDTFWGIPFAAPPVGNLRWEPPQAPTKWTSPKKVTAIPPICPQGKVTKAKGTEDCLTLDVYTPHNRTAGQKLPVMVWIHGGGFVDGNSHGDSDPGFHKMYDGTNRVNQFNVVYVSMNYRMGTLGFLSADYLRAVSPTGSSGNYGLMDQRMALQWVQDNIANFGGDPTKVMAFGESAGGCSICYHYTSPLSKGLFHALVGESALCSGDFPFLERDVAENFGRLWTIKMGCDKMNDTAKLECMRSKSVDEIIQPSLLFPFELGPNTEPIPLPPGMPVYALWPTVDGTEAGVVDRPLQMIKKGSWNNVPIILGSNHNEGSIFTIAVSLVINEPMPYTPAKIKKALVHLLGENATLINKIMTDIYPQAEFSNENERMGHLLRDYFLACPSRAVLRAANEMAPKVAKTYMYMFNRTFDSLLYSLLGDFHGSELPYVFDNKPGEWTFWDKQDQTLSMQMGAYWAGMAKGADPNTNTCGDCLRWPQYTATGANPMMGNQNLVLEAPLRYESELYHRQCDFWDSVGYIHNQNRKA